MLSIDPYADTETAARKPTEITNLVEAVQDAAALVSALDAHADCRQIVLEEQLGETVIRDGTLPDWTWPSR